MKLLSNVNDRALDTGTIHLSANCLSGGVATLIRGWLDVSPGVWLTVDSRVESRCPVIKGFAIPESAKFDWLHNFCRDLLWPLAHYSPDTASVSERAIFESHFRKVTGKHRIRAALTGLKSVNLAAARAVAHLAEESGISSALIHDFQFVLVPKYLSRIAPWLNVGLVWHIPAPRPGQTCAKIRHAIEPLMKSCLAGLSAANFVAISSDDCRRDFQRLDRLSGIPYRPRYIIVPPGIPLDPPCDSIPYPQSFGNVFEFQTLRKAQQLVRQGRKVIFSADRFDYSKGHLLRVSQLRELFRNNPNLLRSHRVVIHAVPTTRGELGERMCNEVRARVREVNAEFQSETESPLIYFEESEFSDALEAQQVWSWWFRRADVVLLTSIREGFNLTVMEAALVRANIVATEEIPAAAYLPGCFRAPRYGTRPLWKTIREAIEASPSERVQRSDANLYSLQSRAIFNWMSRIQVEFDGTSLKPQCTRETF